MIVIFINNATKKFNYQLDMKKVVLIFSASTEFD